jgi:hypothetical protein
MVQRTRRSRTFGWETNPLRRRTDRIEAVLAAALIVVFLIAAPALVGVAGHWTRSAGIRQQRAELDWRQVSAIVQRGAPAQRYYFRWPSGTVEMRVRWMAPDGQPRQGWIPVGPAAAPGSSARVWMSRSGSLTGPPLRRTQLEERIAEAEVLTAFVLVLMFFLAGCAVRCLLSRRRLAEWDRAWRAAGPQ